MLYQIFLMKQKIFLWIGIFLLTILGISVYTEFMANHSYYNTMFASRENRKMIIWMIIATIIPIGYILRNKNFSTKNFLLKWIPSGLLLASISYILTKDSIFGSTGLIILCVNTLLVYGLGLYFLGWLLSIWTRISNKWINFKEIRRQEIAINFGIGLAVFLLLTKALIIFDLMYGIVARAILVSFGIAIYFNRKSLWKYGEIIGEMMESFQKKELKKDRTKRIWLLLIAISIIYYFYWFQLSFIPYSTAWDANHDYMYIPKILAENHGVLRGNNGPGGGVPFLWHSLLAFRFSISESIPNFRLGPNTLAVAMNFLSGPLTLLLGLGIIKEILWYFTKKQEAEEKEYDFWFYLGWFLLLLRLTSGMGAFLVFVDNKTDLGVMTITLLALLSGFIFMSYLKKHNTKEEIRLASKYIITSGVFFSLASMAKPTAFIDIALFGLVMIALRFNPIITIGIGTMIVGATGVLKIANAPDLLSVVGWTWVMWLGLIISCIWIIQILWEHKKKRESWLLSSLKYIGIRTISIVVMLVVFKGSHQIYSNIKDWSFTPGTFVKNLIVGYNTNTLLASNTNTEEINAQKEVDQTYKSNLPPAVCKETKFSTEELEKSTQKAYTTNEDVGRYVWYGRKEIKQQWRSVGYGLLKVFFPINDRCYSFNKNARILCENWNAIDNFEIKTLRSLLSQLKEWWSWYEELSGAISAFDKKWYTDSSSYNPQEFRDQIVSLRTYYQSNAIKSVAGTISIPYKFIIPLNISFNRSLQNLSSYYTDIWFIRIFAMGFILLGFMYGLIKRDRDLITVSSVTIIGRAIRWIIGGGILWYGMGLIMWTILGTIMYISKLGSDDTKKESLAFTFFLCLLAIRGILQLFFNLIRISSQWVGGPFAWYRMNIWQTIEFNESLQQEQVLKNGYNWKDVFDLQFPHYNKFINYVVNRKNEDGVLIAGTYIQYFLKNQRNITMDGMLSRFWELASDNDSCKTSQRLKNANIKYLVIDPNIGTVGMGEGNESLFQRFFAKLSSVSGKIEKQGAITMLVKMHDDGFLKLLSTNNLWAKYAFTLNNDVIQNKLWVGAEDIILAKAKLSVARYFSDADKYIQFIAETLSSRMANGLAIWDIADVLGKNIDEAKVIGIAQTILGNGIKDESALTEIAKTLTQDERYILTQYIGIVKMAQTAPQQYQEALNSILSQSLWSSSQLMTFEVIQ